MPSPCYCWVEIELLASQEGSAVTSWQGDLGVSHCYYPCVFHWHHGVQVALLLPEVVKVGVFIWPPLAPLSHESGETLCYCKRGVRSPGSLYSLHWHLLPCVGLWLPQGDENPGFLLDLCDITPAGSLEHFTVAWEVEESDSCLALAIGWNLCFFFCAFWLK